MLIHNPESLSKRAERGDISAKRLLAHAFAFKGSPPTPQAINLQKELQQTLKGEQSTAGGFLGLNQQYNPLYNLLGLQSTQQQEFGTPQQPGLLQQGIAATGLTGTGNIGNVSALGGPAEQAYLQGNPALSKGVGAVQSGLGGNPLLSRLSQIGSAEMNQGTLSQSPIMQALQGQAQSELSQGGMLAPDQLQQIQQATRAQFASQGLAGTNPDLASEAVNTSAAQQARLAQAQQFAGGVQSLEGQALGQEFGQGLSAEQALQQQNRNNQLGTQTLFNTTLNPWSAIVGGAAGLPTATNIYNPTGLPGGNLASQNAALQYQGQLNQYQAQQQQLQGVGSSLGSALMIGLTAAGF